MSGPASDPAAASPSLRLFVAFLVARAAFGLVFLVTSVGRLPLFWYHPLEHRWAWEAKPAGLAMGWYGTTALALVAAAAAGAVTYRLARSLRRWLGSPSVARGIAHAGGLVLLVDFLYFGWTLTHQTPAPLDLPSWYCPR